MAMGWNLPPGCTDRDIEIAAGAFDEQPEPMTEEEQRADAWEYWHQRANRLEEELHRLRHDMTAALKDIEFIVDGKEDADDGKPNDAMKIQSVVQTALRIVGAA